MRRRNEFLRTAAEICSLCRSIAARWHRLVVQNGSGVRRTCFGLIPLKCCANVAHRWPTGLPQSVSSELARPPSPDESSSRYDDKSALLFVSSPPFAATPDNRCKRAGDDTGNIFAIVKFEITGRQPLARGVAGWLLVPLVLGPELLPGRGLAVTCSTGRFAAL